MALRHHLQPLKEYQRAKRFAWDPQTLDLRRDTLDWAKLGPPEQDILRDLLSLFLDGEEAVATDLASMLWAVGQAGDRREDEMFLTSQLFDGSVHVEFFHRWLEIVASHPVDRSRHTGENCRALFDELSRSLGALITDQSPRALALALVTCHLTVEGTLAETGYRAASLACERRGVLPGLTEGLTLVRRDESRHIAYGIHALECLLAKAPELWGVVHESMDRMLPRAIAVIPEALAPHGAELPFGLRLDEAAEFAEDQFNKWREALKRTEA